MIFVRLDWCSSVDGNRVEWFDSTRAARTRAVRLPKDESYFVGQPVVERVNVPTDPKHLLAWLNEYLKSANV